MFLNLPVYEFYFSFVVVVVMVKEYKKRIWEFVVGSLDQGRRKVFEHGEDRSFRNGHSMLFVKTKLEIR